MDEAYAHKRYQPDAFFNPDYVEWTAVQARYAGAGTQGQWSAPTTCPGVIERYKRDIGYMIGSLWDEYQNPSSPSPTAMRMTARMDPGEVSHLWK